MSYGGIGSYSCGKCGRSVAKDAGRCPHCGARLAGIRCNSCGFAGGSSDFAGDCCPKCGSMVRSSGPDLPSWFGHAVLIGTLVVGVGGYGLYKWNRHASTGTVEGTISCRVPAEDRSQLVLFVEPLDARTQVPEGPRPIRVEADFPYVETLYLDDDVMRTLECTDFPCLYEADGLEPGSVSICAAFTKEGGTLPFIHTGSVLGCAPLVDVLPGETAAPVDFELDYVTGSGTPGK